MADVKERFCNGVPVVVFYRYLGYIMTGHFFATDIIELNYMRDYNGRKEQYAGACGEGRR
jgi:hypothetical protein